MAFLDLWTGIDSEEEQLRQDKLDAQLRLENEKDRASRGEDWFQQAQAHVDQGQINVTKTIKDAFWGNEPDPSDDPTTPPPTIDPIYIHIAIGVLFWIISRRAKK